MLGSKDRNQSALLRRLKIIRDYASGLSSDCEAGGYYEYEGEKVNLVWNLEASIRSAEAQYTIFVSKSHRFHTHPSLDSGPSSMDIFSYNVGRFREQELIIEGNRAIVINNPQATSRKKRAFLFVEWQMAVDRFTAFLLQLQKAEKSNRYINDSTFNLIRREFIKRYLDFLIKEFSGSIGVTNYDDSFNDESTWIKVLTRLFGLEVELIPYGEDGQPLKGAIYPPQLIKSSEEHFLKFYERGTEAIREIAEQTLNRFDLLTDDTRAFLEQKAETKLQAEKIDINKYPTDQEKYKHIFVYLGEDVLQNIEQYKQEIIRIAKDNRVVIIAKDEAEAVRLREQRFTDNIVDILIAGSEYLKNYDIVKIRNNVSGVTLPNELAWFGARLDAISKIDPELAKAVLSGV